MGAVDVAMQRVTTAEALNDLLPPHKAGLFIEHNPHRNYYQSVGECLNDRGITLPEAELATAIERDELWLIQWYPETPVGSHSVAGASLATALMRAQGQDGMD